MYHPLTPRLPLTCWAPRATVFLLLVACAPSDFDALERDRARANEACDTRGDGALDPARCTPEPEQEDGADDEDGEMDAGAARSDGGEIADADATDTRAEEAGAREIADVGTDRANDDPSGSAELRDAEAGACDACADATPPARCGGQMPVCSAGRPDMERRACGSCGAGTQVRARSCAEDGCSWGAWGAWSACAEPASECSAGQVDTQSEACGACNTGTRTRTRSCSSVTCSWEEWGAWSGCGGVTAVCTPGDTSACDPADSCGHRVCSNSCTWGGCVPAVANGCLRRRGGTQEEGSNYRCCGGGRWQFCLPSCQWSADCAACSPDNCEC